MERCFWKPAFLALLILSMVTAAFTGCKDRDDDDDDPTVVADSGTIKMHLHNFVEANEVELYGAVYETEAELRKISVDIAQVYLSDVRLVSKSGNERTIPGVIVLKLQTIQTYTLGKVPAGEYKSVRFKVGLSAATNAMEPSESPDATLLDRPEMWFGSTAQPDGYVFARFSGKIDTTADASGNVADMQPFSYKIGTDSRRVEVALPDKTLILEKDRTEYLHLIIDWYKLFAGLQLSDPANLSLTTASENAGQLADKLATNIPAMFKYEE
jgi:hypothetical protein